MFPRIPNPKDYEITTDEVEDEVFPANDNFTINRESYFPINPNPKDYENTNYEGEDEEFLANYNFRDTNVNNAFSLSENFKDTHDDE